MYDDEEEIKRKRRKLIIAIAVVVILIILLLIFILSRTGGTKKPETKELACELEVKSGTKGEDGVYSTPVVVGFKSITVKQEDLTKYTVGIRDSSKNEETYAISKKGTFAVYGYLQDKYGNKGTCKIEVKVNPSQPTCELEVKTGTAGENGWYRSNVVVGFKSKNSNSETETITKYYIIKKTTALEGQEEIKVEVPKENVEEFTVTADAETEVVGYVIDSTGNEATCNIVVKKDATPPTCKLAVVDGTPNNNGIYTGNSVVGFEKAEDATTAVAAKGVGKEKNYKNETFAATGNGNITVRGYVKDTAGNEGTCELVVKRPAAEQPKPKDSYPSCTLKIVSGQSSGGTYVGKTKVGFASKTTTNGATITGFGIGTTAVINGSTEFEINTNGTHTIIGMVKDSYGHTATCQMAVTVVMEDNSLAKKVAVGDYVAYDAGNWKETTATPTVHGKFGGYTDGQSKNSSVKCRNNDTTTNSGWRVLSVKDNKVTIVHTGVPECYYYSSYQSNASVAAALDARAAHYKNTFAESARMLKETDISGLAQDHEFRKINSYYYLSTPSAESYGMKFVATSGRITSGGENSQGLRPVITLRADVKTSGKANNAWVLTFDTSKGKEFELPETTGKVGDVADFIKDIIEKS